MVSLCFTYVEYNKKNSVGCLSTRTAVFYSTLFVLSCFCFVLFLTFSVSVANPKKLLYTVANPARGLLNREKITKEKVWQHTPPPPPNCSFGEMYVMQVVVLV